MKKKVVASFVASNMVARIPTEYRGSCRLGHGSELSILEFRTRGALSLASAVIGVVCVTLSLLSTHHQALCDASKQRSHCVL